MWPTAHLPYLTGTISVRSVVYPAVYPDYCSVVIPSGFNRYWIFTSDPGRIFDPHWARYWILTSELDRILDPKK